MPVSAMKACFRIAEHRTIFCKDMLKICNFQIFRLFFALGDKITFYSNDWRVLHILLYVR